MFEVKYWSSKICHASWRTWMWFYHHRWAIFWLFVPIGEWYRIINLYTMIPSSNWIISRNLPWCNSAERSSFRSSRGRSPCFVGENGSGKSTLVKILSGAYKRPRHNPSQSTRNSHQKIPNRRKNGHQHHLSGTKPCAPSFGCEKFFGREPANRLELSIFKELFSRAQRSFEWFRRQDRCQIGKRFGHR